MATPLSSSLKIETYLEEMKTWLDADIKRYKGLFSSALSRNPNDFTRAPGVIYTTPLPTEPPGVLSIPLASSILSAMEFCGFCLKGNFKNFSKSEKNIKRFYREIKGLLSGSSPNANEIGRLIISCRHGFAHKFFPKHQIGVGYLDYTSDLFVTDSTGFVLNTNALINHIQIGLDHILSTPSLFPAMQMCYDNYINQVENGVVTVTLSTSQRIWKKIKTILIKS